MGDLVAYEPLQSDCHMYVLVNVRGAIRLVGTPICGWCGNPCGIRAYEPHPSKTNDGGI